MMDAIYAWPAWPLIVLLLVLMFAANELGYYFGRSFPRDEADISRNMSNTLKGSIFGLVAFLLAFAFSITGNRHDMRRKVVLDEANALGTCYLRAELLSNSSKTRLQDVLRKYVDVRLAYFNDALVEAKSAREYREMERLLNELWAGVVESTKSNREITLTSQIIPAANEVIDLNSTRNWAVRSHLEPLVLILLMVGIIISSALIGHSFGQGQQRHVGLWTAFNIVFALVLFVVLDLDRSRRGFIQLNHQPLLELKASINPGSPPVLP